MALLQPTLLPNNCLATMPRLQTKMATKSSKTRDSTPCKASVNVCNQTPLRRTANFQPSIWHYDYIQSLSSEYKEELYADESRVLREEVKMMLWKVQNPLNQLELVDVLQRLGVAYHFESQIKEILENVYNMYTLKETRNNLYATALEFRLLRQHGYNVSAEVFDSFRDEMGNLKKSLSADIEGMLSFYEASFYLLEDETMLEEAGDFSSRILIDFVNKSNDNDMSLLVSHALEFPLHWKMPRLETRWYIDVCEKRQNMSLALLNLAKLDFNIVQAIHQDDLKHTSRWWKRTGLGEKLSFTRDRLVENFFWTVGFAFQPHLGYFRRVMTKVNAFITTIDDIYDVYGPLEELELFTNVVDRWDVNEAQSLPNYMKICFLALYNFVNELALDTLKETKHYIIPDLKKAWGDLCKSYLVEAKWYYSGYIPCLQEYMENAWISISAPTILVHAYFLTANPIRKEDLDCLEEYPNIMRFSAMILRLADDLGTSEREMEMGDVPKSIQCYMNENGASEADAREHIKRMIYDTWMKMNAEVQNSPFSKSFREIAMNLGRMALCMYQDGDGHTVQDPQTKNRILSLLIQPIPFVASKI